MSRDNYIQEQLNSQKRDFLRKTLKAKPQERPTVEFVRHMFKMLAPEDKMKVMAGYCPKCGRLLPNSENNLCVICDVKK